jgi:hypothetical protein
MMRISTSRVLGGALVALTLSATSAAAETLNIHTQTPTVSVHTPAPTLNSRAVLGNSSLKSNTSADFHNQGSNNPSLKSNTSANYHNKGTNDSNLKSNTSDVGYRKSIKGATRTQAFGPP